nr:protein kinase-like domain-containing protein [Tanacetum cinerariifolium]
MNSPKAMIFLSSSSLISFLFYGLMITCLTFATVFASYGGNETDYHALLSFKSTITHDPYKVLNSWNNSFHFCEWSGILCGKRHKRVIALILESQVLEGSLSPHQPQNFAWKIANSGSVKSVFKDWEQGLSSFEGQPGHGSAPQYGYGSIEAWKR